MRPGTWRGTVLIAGLLVTACSVGGGQEFTEPTPSAPQATEVDLPDLPERVACAEVMAAVADDGKAALHIRFAGLLEHARRVDRSEFTYDDLGVHAYVNVAFVRDEDAWGAYCSDTGGVDVYDEVWPAARGTAHVELGEEQPPNQCGELTRHARVRLEDVELRGPDGRIMHVDELEFGGWLGWSPPDC